MAYAAARDICPGTKRITFAALISALVPALFTPDPAAAGSAYSIRTQSTSVLGSAQAGMSAGDYDLSRMVLNPAALGLGRGTELTNNIAGISLRQRADGVAATTTLGTQTGGGQGGDSGVRVAVPNFYSAFNLDERVRLGLGFTSYYGLGQKWDAGWAGRYYAGSASILVSDIVPVISFRPVPSLILAGGPVIEYVRVKTDTAIDFGTADQLLTGGAFGGRPGGSDGSLNTRATNWSAGFILGATYEPWQGTRIGVSWRSQVRHQLTGNANFSTGGSTGQSLAAATGGFANTRLRSGLNHPAALIFGVSQDVTPKLTLFADAQRLGWSSVQEANLNFANPVQPQARNVLSLRDTWYVAFGGRYRVDDTYAVRAGVGLDQAATRTATRTVLLPDSFAVWTTVGLEIRMSENLRIDLAYGHLFAANASLAQTATQPGNELRGNLAANIRTASDFLSVQATWKF